MNLAYVSDSLSIYLEDAAHPFRPWPARDASLSEAVAAPFCLDAPVNDWTAFQLIVSMREDASITRLSADGAPFTCISTEGVDARGEAFVRAFPIEAEKPWPLYCLIRAEHAGEHPVTILYEDSLGHHVEIACTLYGRMAFTAAEQNRATLARLAWLNSRAGYGDRVPSPYCPVAREGRRLRILGREILLGANGLPEQIYSFFQGANDSLCAEGKPILSNPLEFTVSLDGESARFTGERLVFTREAEDCVAWKSEGVCGEAHMTIYGELEFDGMMRLRASIRTQARATAQVAFVYRPAEAFARCFIGLGMPGGALPESHDWRWDAEKHQDACWVGATHGGLWVRPKEWGSPEPFVNAYFHHGPRNMPACWIGGGFHLRKRPSVTLAYESGPLEVTDAGRDWDLEMMVTPLKCIDWARHYGIRHYQDMPTTEDHWPELARQNGCTGVVVHHASNCYPFINYPMYTPDAVRRMADATHAQGLFFKVYYSIRELTSRLPEFWAFRSLRDEIFPKPTYNQGGLSFQGGVDPFLAENAGDTVIPAWKHIFPDGPYEGQSDPAVISNPAGRLANFYAEGLRWMLKNLDIDGIYIDDIGGDRRLLRRVRHLFDEYKPNALIDMHSWNHFEDKNGAGYGHNAVIYAPLMPYMNSLMIGESFDYDNATPEYLMTEVAGIPFGLPSEMLERGGNFWRGMLYGMTARVPWCKPQAVWKLQDDFDVRRSQMRGYWDEQPVHADERAVLCTVYEHESGGRLLCCCANFATDEVEFALTGKALAGKRLFLPEVDGMQRYRPLKEGERIRVPKAGGAFIWIEDATLPERDGK